MYVIGIVLDDKNVTASLYGDGYKQLAEKELSCSDRGILNDASEVINCIISEQSICKDDISFVGVAISGKSESLVNIARKLEKLTGIKTVSETLINAKALGEAFLSGDKPSLVMLNINETIESAIVIDKKIYSGVNCLGGRVAHMVIYHGGFECSCGRKGCFEAYVSNRGLKRIASESGVEISSLTVKKLFDTDSDNATVAKKRYISKLAGGLTDIINLFQPDELVLEGPFLDAGNALMDPVMDIVLKEQYSSAMENKCNVRAANKNINTAVLGAALILR